MSSQITAAERRQGKNFSMSRFLNILKIDIRAQKTGVIITISIVLGIHFIGYLVSAFARSGSGVHAAFFANTLFIGGLIGTSLAFHDFYKNDRSYFSLMLPGSQFEKYLSKFLITTVGYIIGSLLIYIVYSFVAMGLSFAFFQRTLGVFNPFAAGIWKIFAGYMVAHAVFFFGSAYFKSAAFLKTLLSLIIFAIGVTIFAALVSALSAFTWIRDIISVAVKGFDPIQMNVDGQLEGFFLTIGTVVKIFFLFIMPPALWIGGYFRFKEIEVR